MRRPDPSHAPRIVAGRFRGRALLVPAGIVTRPVRTLVRRSLFDSLQPLLLAGEGAIHWLDLYAGSGSFGLEALSRGAVHATFVEAGREGIRCLSENLERLGLSPPEAVLLTGRLPGLLLEPPPAGAPFDFVSLDPPFAICHEPQELDRLVQGLGRAAAAGWLAPGAIVLWEEPADAPAPVPAGFVVDEQRTYGRSRVRRLAWRNPKA